MQLDVLLYIHVLVIKVLCCDYACLFYVQDLTLELALREFHLAAL